MEKKYEAKTVDEKFMVNMRQKFNTKQKDPVTLETQTMKGILAGIVQVPEKLHMVTSPGKSSVKAAKEGENQLHTGEGKDLSESTM
jgi:hypothetical protein